MNFLKRICLVGCLFIAALIFLIQLWMESWLGPEEDDEDAFPPPE